MLDLRCTTLGDAGPAINKHWASVSYLLGDATESQHQRLKVWSTVKIRGTRVPQKAIVPVGRPRPYSIIILNMRFIPKASLRASSQITASSYILERHLWVNNSKLFALAPTWSLACKQTDCITAGMLKLLDPKLVLTFSQKFYIYSMLVQCWASVADVGLALKQHWINVPFK